MTLPFYVENQSLNCKNYPYVNKYIYMLRKYVCLISKNAERISINKGNI